jgi:hypothetical protein
MNVGQYRTLLGDLELKKAELMQVSDQYAFGYAKVVLDNAAAKVQAEIDELLSLELMPVPSIVSISASTTTISASVGTTEQVTITARMSDGSMKDVTKAKFAYAHFKDYNTVFNNTGNMTNVDVTGFVLNDGNKYRVVKTATGWAVYDDLDTDGLAVVPTGGSNEYKIVDIDGNDLGIVFTTDGTEVKGDNWLIDVTVALTGTIYMSSDESVVTVDGNGGIIPVGTGTAQVTVTNGPSSVTIDVTVA